MLVNKTPRDKRTYTALGMKLPGKQELAMERDHLPQLELCYATGAHHGRDPGLLPVAPGKNQLRR